jgi:hypothetical protein
MNINQILVGAMLTCSLHGGMEAEPPRAARSVHLGWLAPEGTVFYIEMTVAQSTAGSFFMACGWNTGYFGIQELADGRHVAIFSVWDPTDGDDPGAVTVEDRVQLLHSDPSARIRRFGGEGTGGQCMLDFPWKLDEPHRFLVHATVEGNWTAYAGFLYFPEAGQWKHLVTFRTRTGGQPLKGYYSFVEDFRRDGASVGEVRQASYSNGWIRSIQGEWVSLTQARFTASGAEWESKDNIDAGVTGSKFYLTTGGTTRQTVGLRARLAIAPPGLTLPEPLVP